ncbi:MAG: DUF4240 domain-containing protein [Rhodobacterales bacterium]|nr:DUF4240 domain-containing protein [Rhodobacterales bacterium]
MDKDTFWALIQAAHDQSGGDMDRKDELIRATVAALPKDDAIAFYRQFRLAMAEAYAWPLWAAAYLVNGGCSDDCFTDFRSSLISRGRAVFESALADPDSLADLPYDEEAWFHEGFEYAILEGTEAVAGERTLDDALHPDNPSGGPWDEDDLDYYKTNLPRLWARHG